MKHQAITLISALLLLPFFANAQKLVDTRDQATGWYVPVKFKVTAQGGDAKTVDVQVYKENSLVHDIPNSKGKFALNLDLGSTYTIILAKPGFRTKNFTMDTSVPQDVVEYPGYACVIDLDADEKYTHADPFYLDFPSVIVSWDDEAHGFMPHMNYLSEIQSKVAMLRAQMDPR